MVVLDENSEFHERLNAALDLAHIPEDPHRRSAVAKRFGVSVESARKWLVGESTPKSTRIFDIAASLGVSSEWLLTGRGRMPLSIDNKENAKNMNEDNGGYGNLSPEAQEIKMLLNEIQGYSLTELKRIVKIKKAIDDD